MPVIQADMVPSEPDLTVDPGDSTYATGGSGVTPKSAADRPTLPGRYENLGLIAAGSFGEVWRVRDRLLQRVVAMKVLRASHGESGHLRRRFLVEANITADLQHPGIVALYDRGELSDGRLWFTMKEVRGRTLREVIDELHAAKAPDAFRVTDSGWTFRRLIDAFARIAQAIAYAHSREVVHRDLKPENLMVGEFGEVLVMDWGLARRIGEAPAETLETTDPPSMGDTASSSGVTRHGDVVGTPAYMPPEQARGDTQLHGPASDIYSLGAVLYCLLAGCPPYRGEVRSVLTALLSGPPVPVAEAALRGPPLPAELCAVVERAMRFEIKDRYESAEALAADVVAWLDGARRREQALAALEQARAIEPNIAALRNRAAHSIAEARRLQGELRPYDPVEKKRPAWELEDESNKAVRAAALAETRWLEAVHGALSVHPNLPEAHALLAEYYRTRLLEAEMGHRDEDAARAEEMLRIHDRGAFAAFLRGDGRVTLVTDPPGAEVFAERLVLQDRRFVPVPERALGQTPLLEVPLSRGSYLLRMQAPGRHEVRVPVVIERDSTWDGRAPGEANPTPIVLPPEGELGPNECYIPAGWCWTGGDASTPESLPRRRIWIDGFVVQRFPVTTAEYIEFLNDLVAQGREVEAIAACPKTPLSLGEGSGDLAFSRDESGVFGLPPDGSGFRWSLDFPVVLVDWHGGVAYARWLAERTGKPWRLLDELEREKAGRGVDGRSFPWGDQPEPTFACVADTASTEPSRESVQGHPFDESPYGVRGLAGNTRDWCANRWTHEGPRIEAGRLCLSPASAEDLDFRVVKGGVWSGSVQNAHIAARFGARPNMRRPVIGLRVARSYPVTPG